MICDKVLFLTTTPFQDFIAYQLYKTKFNFSVAVGLQTHHYGKMAF